MRRMLLGTACVLGLGACTAVLETDPNSGWVSSVEYADTDTPAGQDPETYDTKTKLIGGQTKFGEPYRCTVSWVPIGTYLEYTVPRPGSEYPDRGYFWHRGEGGTNPEDPKHLATFLKHCGPVPPAG